MFVLSFRSALLFLLCMQCSLFGMFNIETAENKITLFELIAENSFLYRDYDVHRAIAVLSKTYNDTIEQKYRATKKRIESFHPHYKFGFSGKTGHVSWNEDFSECAMISIVEARPEANSSEKSLQLDVFSLKENNPVYHQNSGVWGKFEYPIFEDNVRPFFNKEGRACFYGYGKTQDYSIYDHFDEFMSKKIIAQALLEYSIGADCKRKCCHCMYVIGGNHYSFAPIFNFPLLVQALLRSTKVNELSDNYGNLTRSYYIEGVTLPEGYKIFKKHSACEQSKINDRSYKYMSYEAIADGLRNAFDTRYAEQQQEKNNNILEEK